MDDLNATLTAIRETLGCERGGEVEAVRLVMDEHRRTIEAFAIATDVLDRVTVELGCVAGDDLVQAVQEVKDEGASARALLDAALRAHAPTPGDVLTPDDFGRDEAGVLRLAALLAEAPEGAVVESTRGHRWHWKGDGLWVSAAVRRSLLLVEAHAPLTVVAWPS